MTTLLILSDVHRYKDRMDDILSYETYDLLVSLGDSELLIEDLKAFDIVIHGNYLNDPGEPFQILKVEDFNLYFSHGHLEKVHFDDTMLIQKLDNKKCDMAFHGHTHVARVKETFNGTIVNPGAVSYSRSKDPESYLIAIFEKNQCELIFKDLNHTMIKKHTIQKGNK